MMTGQKVCVTIVSYNSRRYIGSCLESVLQQSGAPIEVVVVDNASSDSTREILGRYRHRVRVIYNARNVGFAAAQNQAMAASASDWVLALNPDVVLLNGFISRLLEAGEMDEQVGTVCGKLLSIGPDLQPVEQPRIDSAGMYFTPAARHFDRGWHEPDDGRFEQMEYVFGASAAAALYRRRMIDDIAEGADFFDPDFFVYREDADVAWRAQLLGWRAIYTPGAVAWHVRSVLPGNRLAVPAAINMHSVKNRFLMRIKNMTPDLYRRYWLAVTMRDALVLGGCLVWEQTSLPAFWQLAKCLRRALRHRRNIMRRRRATDEDLARWFSGEAVAQPVTEVAVPAHYDRAPA